MASKFTGIIRTLFILVLFRILVTCTEDNASSEISIPHYEIDNSSIKFLSKYDEVEVDTFIIDKHLVRKIGYSTYSIKDLKNGSLLIEDANLNNLSCVSNNGQLLWHAIPPSPGRDRFESIGAVNVDHSTKEIYVEDRGQFKIHVYSFSGQHLRALNDTPNVDMAVIGRNKIIYDISDIDPYLFERTDNIIHRYLLSHEENLKQFSPMDHPYDDDNISVVYYNRFNSVKGELQHRRPFENTLYQILPEFDIAPLLTIDFSHHGGFSEYGDSPDFKHPSEYFRRHDIARPHIVIKEDNLVIANYFFGAKDDLYFTLFRDDKQVVSPAYYYEFGGVVVDAPQFYDSGSFYTTMFQYKFDYLQNFDPENMSTDKVYHDLEMLDTQFRDDDALVVVKMTF